MRNHFSSKSINTAVINEKREANRCAARYNWCAPLAILTNFARCAARWPRDAPFSEKEASFKILTVTHSGAPQLAAGATNKIKQDVELII